MSGDTSGSDPYNARYQAALFTDECRARDVEVIDAAIEVGTETDPGILSGGTFRERANAPVKTSKSGALRWAQAREAAILAAGKGTFDAVVPVTTAPDEGMPTLRTFWLRVKRDHYEANRKKPSTIDAADSIFR